MRIGFLMLRCPPAGNGAITPDVVRLLSEWGATVDVIYPEQRALDLAGVVPEHDLYVLKSRTEMALCLAGALHAAGATILNPYPISALLRDKVATTRLLQAAGVPTPDTWIADHPDQVAPLLSDGPLVLKPFRGSGSRGVHVVWDAEDLDDVPTSQGPIVAQRFVGRGEDARRVYCIGDQLFGVKRVWPARTYEERVGVAFTVPPRLREIAFRCRKAFGIDVFTLEIIGTKDDPYVVDVQSFPSFLGVPDAALRLADYIYHAACRIPDEERQVAPAIAALVAAPPARHGEELRRVS